MARHALSFGRIIALHEETRRSESGNVGRCRTQRHHVHTDALCGPHTPSQPSERLSRRPAPCSGNIPPASPSFRADKAAGSPPLPHRQDGPLDSRTKLVLYNALATCNGQCGRKASKLPNCLCRFAPPPPDKVIRDKDRALWRAAPSPLPSHTPSKYLSRRLHA